MKKFALIAIAAASLSGGANAQSTGPTCSDADFLGVDVHGQHIIRDYLAGGDAATSWPVDGADLGSALADEGPYLAGGPGNFGHLQAGYAPGASFCTDGAQSWGVPRGGH